VTPRTAGRHARYGDTLGGLAPRADRRMGGAGTCRGPATLIDKGARDKPISGGWLSECAVDEAVELVEGERAGGLVGGGEVDVFVDEGHVEVE
jgi:hypothetical protein